MKNSETTSKELGRFYDNHIQQLQTKDKTKLKRKKQFKGIAMETEKCLLLLHSKLPDSRDLPQKIGTGKLSKPNEA